MPLHGRPVRQLDDMGAVSATAGHDLLRPHPHAHGDAVALEARLHELRVRWVVPESSRGFGSTIVVGRRIGRRPAPAPRRSVRRPSPAGSSAGCAQRSPGDSSSSRIRAGPGGPGCASSTRPRSTRCRAVSSREEPSLPATETRPCPTMRARPRIDLAALLPERLEMAAVVRLLLACLTVDHVVAELGRLGPGEVTATVVDGRRVQQRLGRHAGPECAGPADELVLDDGDARPARPRQAGRSLAGGTRTDDHEVDVRHSILQARRAVAGPRTTMLGVPKKKGGFPGRVCVDSRCVPASPSAGRLTSSGVCPSPHESRCAGGTKRATSSGRRRLCRLGGTGHPPGKGARCNVGCPWPSR